MDRITHQSPRQRGYGSTSSLRNDSLKHTWKHERRREESNQGTKLPGTGGLSGQVGWTVRKGHADSPVRCRATVRKGHADRPTRSHGPSVKANRTTRTNPRKMDRPRRPGGPSAWFPDRPLLKLRPSATDCNENLNQNRIENEGEQERDEHVKNWAEQAPRGRSVERGGLSARSNRAEKSRAHEVNPTNSSPEIPNGSSSLDKIWGRC
jgi:hypothetical protein